MDAPNVGHLRGLTRRITSARCFPAKEEAMKSIPTEIVDRPMLVQEVGGNRTWEAETTDPFCNVWYEVTGGKTDWSKRWCRVDCSMMTEEEAERL